jgi:hypothetical protein
MEEAGSMNDNWVDDQLEIERLRQENAKLRKIVGVMREHVHEFCAARFAPKPGYLDLCVLPVDHDGEHIFGEV